MPQPSSGNTHNFSAAVAAGDLLFVSGQASVQDGKVVRDSFAKEMERSIENLRLVLEAWDLTFADVIKVGAYVRDEADLSEYNELYPRYFRAPLPARTTLTGCLPDTIKFEIDAIASLSAGRVKTTAFSSTEVKDGNVAASGPSDKEFSRFRTAGA